MAFPRWTISLRAANYTARRHSRAVWDSTSGRMQGAGSASLLTRLRSVGSTSAWKFVEPFQGKAIMIRYKPEDPAESRVTLEELRQFSVY